MKIVSQNVKQTFTGLKEEEASPKGLAYLDCSTWLLATNV
jgi:hypothetical protein